MIRRIAELLPAFLLLGALTLDGACSSSGEDRASADNEAQVRFEAAKRALEEILERQQRGLPRYADCHTAKMLFLDELKAARSNPEAQRLAVQLLRACQGASPNEIVEIRQ